MSNNTEMTKYIALYHTREHAAETLKALEAVQVPRADTMSIGGSDTTYGNGYSVANYLKGQGIEGSRLTGDGFGPANPADTNSTEAGKADNRRVELFKQ